MKEESLSPAVGSVGYRKRKWSPSGSDSGSTIKNEHQVSRSPDASLSDDNMPAEGGSFATKALGKRTRLSKLVRPLPLALAKATVQTNVPHDRSLLPQDIWQYVFSFLPPTTLGQLLQINHSFNDLLTPGRTLAPNETSRKGTLSLQNQEHLWSTSRKMFFPGLPRPPSVVSELELWRLLRGYSCQYCGKRASTNSLSTAPAPWSAGPGPDNIRVIWPFAVRACSPCLRTRLRKETDLLFSSSSALIPALPFAFFTPSLHFVASVTLRSTPVPSGLQLTKYYFEPGIDEMREEMTDVIRLGHATAEEWYKGLEDRGQAKLADSSRWEQWELTGGFQSLTSSSGIRSSLTSGVVRTPGSHATNPDRASNEVYNSSSKVHPLTSMTARIDRPVASPLPQVMPSGLPAKPATPASHYQHGQQLSLPPQIPAPKPIQPHVPQPRMERSIRDVTEMKASRRADIEKRCLELDLPITAATLIHMDSFAAAIQIPMALNDNAWEVLKPRLLAQREVAEGREQQQRAASQLLHAKTEERRQQEAQLKEARETLDREWEEMQKPVRDKIDAFADEIIRDGWRDGQNVNKDTCAQFAADVLVYVYKRFSEVIAQQDAAMEARGLPIPADSSSGTSTRKLTLENMKWVFDGKVKPFTERHRKELFLCNACDNQSKYYALDAVIQHFAAKHTSALSMGTAVVYWRAEWPAEPPFNPDPSAGRPISNVFHPGSHLTMNSSYSTSPGQTQFSTANGASSPSCRSPLSYFPGSRGPPPLGHHRATHLLSPTFDHHSYGAHSTYEQHNRPTLAPQFSPTFSRYAHQKFPVPPDEIDHRSVRVSSSMSYLGAGYYKTYSGQPPHMQPSTVPARAYQAGPLGQSLGIYHVQVEELAKNAREIWDGTSGVKDLPSSVRIQVIINHVVLRFTDKYTNEPNLALFTDGLNNNSQMRPIRDLSGLVCKSCTTPMFRSGPSHNLSHGRTGEEELHTLPALLAHFQSAHIEHGQPNVIPQTGIEIPRLDWKFDMVELPEPSVVGNLMKSPGIDYTKLSLIATVLPKFFPSPLPKIEAIPNLDAEVQEKREWYNPRHGLGARSSHSDLNPRSPCDRIMNLRKIHPQRRRDDGLDVVEDNFPTFVDSQKRNICQDVEPAGDDEYDPHRPSYQLDRAKTQRLAYCLPHIPGDSRASPQTVLVEHDDLHWVSGTSRRPLIETAAPFTTQQRPLDVSVCQSLPFALANDLSAVRPYLGHRPPSQENYDAFSRNHSPRKSPNLPVGTGEVVDSPRVTAHEPSASAPIESLNAAEQSLSNFDPGADPDTYCIREAARRKPVETSRSIIRESAASQARFLDPVEFSANDGPLQALAMDTDIVVGSHRATSVNTRQMSNEWSSGARSPVTINHCASDVDRAFNDRVPQPDLYGQRLRDLSPYPADFMKPLEDHVHHGARHIQGLPGQRSQTRYELLDDSQVVHYPPRRGSPSILEPLRVDTMYYPERTSEPRHFERQALSHRAPGFYRYQERLENPFTHSRTAPSNQSHYVDDKRYIETTYGEPVGYVRLSSRDSLAPERHYFTERVAPRELPNQYVGYGSDLSRGSVLEHNGKLYERTVQDQGAQGPYFRQARYQ